MILPGNGIRLVSTSGEDPEISAIRQDWQVLQNLSEVHLYPEPMPDSVVFRIEEGERLVGEAALKTIKWFNHKAEISIFIIPDCQRKGIGKAALTHLMEFAFHTMNLYRLEAEVVDYNEPAKKLFEKLGFVVEGRLRSAKFFQGKYYDIIRYGILREEFKEVISEA